MNTLKYNGYIGSVGYSEPDKIFFGKIEGIKGLVNYEGESVAELTAAFHEAVEDYLAFCKEQGIKPEKSYTGTFNVRIPPSTHRDIANMAAASGISINALVKRVLGEAVGQPKNKDYTYIQQFGQEEAEPAMLMERPAPRYGSWQTLALEIPARDINLAKEIAERFGWGLSLTNEEEE